MECNAVQPGQRMRDTVRGRWLHVHPMCQAIAALLYAPNTNVLHCASKFRRSLSFRPNESFVTPLSCRLSRSLTGTLFWPMLFLWGLFFRLLAAVIRHLTTRSFLNKRGFYCFICFRLSFDSCVRVQHSIAALAQRSRQRPRCTLRWRRPPRTPHHPLSLAKIIMQSSGRSVWNRPARNNTEAVYIEMRWNSHAVHRQLVSESRFLLLWSLRWKLSALASVRSLP